ncbi:hypothetical protein CDD82_4558 [Ophiocordyceps australis]|uniref:Uncharacterized protein n=1 Tax=Ophiocordyceps australis TaxID=1399860 RepID=A0A2C5Z7J7_9HYPO|nr:hypothetical protein CDD82_4558 [Ophiocordyceps australis]
MADKSNGTVADDPQGAREIEMRQTLDAAAIELPQSPSPSCLDDAETELPQSPVPSFLNAAEVELPQSPAPSRPETPETTPLIGTKVEEGNMLLTLCSESTVEKPSSNMENVDDSACAHSNELELQAKPTQEPILITKQDASLKADTGYSALQKISEDILPETGINCGVDSADNTAPENTLNLGESNAIQGPAAKEVVTVLAKLSKKERRRRRKLEAAFEALSTDLPETRIASEVESDPAHASPSVAPEQIEEKGAKGQVDEVPNDSFNAKEGASSATIISENAGVSVDSSSGQPIDGSEANTDEEWTESTSKIESKKKKRKKKKGKTLMPLSSESMVPEIAELLESDAQKSPGKSRNVKSAETVTFDTANSSMSTQSQAATMNQDDQQATLERTVSGDAATKLATDLEAQVAPHSASVVPNLNDEQILNLEASGTTGELPETCNRETTVFDGEASRQELGMDPLALTSELTMQPEDKTEVVGTAQLPSGDLEPQIGKQATCKDLDHSVKSIERHEMDKDALVEPVKETDLMKATMVDMDSPAVEEVKDHADGLEGGGHDDIFIRKMLESKSLETAQPLEHVPSKTKIQEEDSRSETLPESIPLPPQDATELSTLNQASESLVADGTKSFETEADSQHGKLEGQEQKLPQRKLSKKERRLLKKISGLGQRSTEAKQEATSLVEKSESAPDPNQASAAPEVSSASDIDSDAKQEVASEEQKGTDEKQDMCSSQESKKEEEQALDEALAPLTLSDGTLGVSTSLANEVEKDQSSRLQDLDAQAGEKESVGVLESESCGIQSAEDISEPAANAEEIALQTPLPVSKDLELESLAEEESKAAERQFQFAAEECKTAADQKDQSPIDLPLPVSEEEETRLVAEQEVKSEARQSSKCAMDTKINAAEDEEDQIALQTRLPHSDAEAEKRQMAPVDDGFEAALQVEPESHKPLQSSLGGETFQGASAVAATMHKSPADADFAPVAREKSQDGLFEGDAGFEAPIAATEPDSSSFGQQVIATRPHSRVAAEQGDKEHEADSSIICPISKSPEVVDSDDLSEAVACEAAPTDSEAAALAKRLAQVADQYRSSAQMEQETSHGEAVRESRRKPGSMPTQAGRVTADNFWTMLSNSKRRKDAKKTMDSQAVQAADPIMSRSSGVGPMEQLIDEAFLTGHQLLSQGEHVASMDDDASASPAIDSGPTAKPAEDDDLEANLFSVAAPTQAPDAGVDSGSDAKPHVSATQESGASFEAVSVQGMSRAARKKAKKKEKKRGLSTGSSSQVEAPVMETPIPSSREPERQVSGADKDVAAGGNKNDAGADADADAEKCAVVAGGGGGGVGGDVANEVATVHDDEAGTRGKVATGRDGEAGAEAEVVPGQDDATGQEAPVEMSPEDDVDAKTTVAMGQDAHDTLNRSAASSGVALLAERFGGGIKRRKKSTGNKIVDKRQAHQVDLFDDAALWEGAGKKSLQPNRDDEADIAFWDAEASRARAEATGADEGHEQTVGHQGMAASRAPWHDGKDKEDVNARAEHQTADQEATATEAESRPRDQEATAAAGASSPTVDQKITTIEVASPTADQDAMAIEPQSPTLCRAFSTNTECPTGNQEAEMLTSGGEAMAIKAESSAVDQAVVTEAESPNVNQVIAEPKSPEAEQNVAIINREASIAPVEPRMADQEALVAETANPEADQEAIIAQIESYMADPSTIVTEAEDLTVKQDEPEPSPLLQKGPEVPEPVGGLLREMEDTEDNNASSETRQSATGALPVVQEVPEAEEVDENSSSGVTGAILSRHGTPVLERRRATPTKRSQESHGDLSAGQDSVMMAAATALAASRLQADRSSSDVGEGQGWAVGPRAMSAPGAGPASTPGPAPHRSASNSSLARGVASPAASTPPPPPPPQLRRADKRMSGDLRAMRQQSSTTPHHHQQQAQLELQQQQPQQPCASAPPSSPSPPVANEGRPRKEPAAADAREKEMADVYDGYGQGRIGSPRSPTRPHSVRRRQSMQVLELESRVEQLLAENRQLADARAAAETSNNQRAVATAALAERNAEIDSLKQSLLFVNNEVARLREINDGLTSANAQLASKDNSTRYADLEVRHDSLSRQLDEARGVHNAVSQTLTEKDAEIAQLHAELDMAKTQIQEMQRRILDSKATDADFLALRDDDYIENRCQMLFSHVQQWVLRFSKFSDMRPCRLTGQVGDDKTIERLDNAVLDGSDVDTYLNDRVRRRDVFLSVTMNMIWEFVFTRYLFGMDREQRQKLKSLEKLLADVGPVHAVRQWRAVTLTLLSRRDSFKTQRELDTEAVVQAIFQTLSSVLPPPSNLEAQIQAQLRRVVAEAVDLSVEMRLQRAEYMMLPPLQPEYDSKGDLTSTVLFDASMMNERGAAMALASNQELEARAAVVRVVLFPIVIKKGDQEGLGDDKIVVYPAQVLTAHDAKAAKRNFASASSDAGGASLGFPSHISVVTETMSHPEAA